MADFNCQECEACCTYFHKDELRENNYPLWGVAIDPKFKDVPLKFVQIGKTLRNIADTQEDADNGRVYSTNKFVKINGLRCAALQGEVGENVSCEIYENRPPVCRTFEAGSEKCLEARDAELSVSAREEK